MSYNDKKYYFAFSCVPSMGPARFKRIQEYFNTLEQAWQASLGEFLAAGLDEKTATDIAAVRNKIDLDLELEKLDQEKITLLTKDDPDYSKLLKEIYGAPFLLYAKGTLKDIRDNFSVAVVGTRKISTYGKQVTEKITKDLVRANLAIISGLSTGIDTQAHEATLAEHGRTIAVVGSGLDKKVLYPPSNFYLAEKIIAEGGLVLSEYPPLTGPQKFFFPQRNRIVSGLALGTLVVEAPVTSGALITAKIALDQNREVFAVPGNILTENAIGPNNLIKMGAHAVSEAQDILLTLNLFNDKIAGLETAKKIKASNNEEKLILDCLSFEPCHIDDIIRITGLDSATINSTLTLMEMTGKVKNLGVMMYVLAQ